MHHIRIILKPEESKQQRQQKKMEQQQHANLSSSKDEEEDEEEEDEEENINEILLLNVHNNNNNNNNNSILLDREKIHFFSGNPAIEITEGFVHLYRDDPKPHVINNNATLSISKEDGKRLPVITITTTIIRIIRIIMNE